MGERTSAKRARYARIACAGAWLFGAAALAAPAPVHAHDRDAARSAESLWDAYPLRPADAGGPAAPSPESAPVNDATSAPSDDGLGVIVLLVAAIAVGGIMAQLVATRLTRSRAVAVAPVRAPPRSPPPRLWTRAGQVPGPELAVPMPLAPPPPALTLIPLPVEMGALNTDRAWAAEIEWHLIDGGSQFRITARPVDGSAERVTLGASEPLEWPPRGSRSVQALTEAVRTLESALTANGWSMLPRGSTWYAKRFIWQPGGGRRRDRPLRLPGQKGSLADLAEPQRPESGPRIPPRRPARG